MTGRKRIFYGAAAVLLLLAGCGDRTNPPGQEEGSLPDTQWIEEAEDRLYRIPVGSNREWVLDRDGREIMEEEYAPFYIDLPDQATGEVRYRYLERYEDDGTRDEWGNAAVKTLRSLWDLEGNQLLDWEDKIYRPAFGDYVVRMDYDGAYMADLGELPVGYRTALYHAPTGEELYEGTFDVRQIGGNYLLRDIWSSPLGIVDAEGKPVSGFPAPETYYNARPWGNYFTANTRHPYGDKGDFKEYLLDDSFQVIQEFDWVSDIYGSIEGDFLIYEDGGERGVFHPEQGVLFSVEDGRIEYYDGELAIVQSGDYGSEESPIRYTLVTVDHREVAGGFSSLFPAQYQYGEGGSERFVGVKEDKVILLGRDGKQLESAKQPGAQWARALADGLYAYQVERNGNYMECLLGPKLEVLAEGDYTSFTLLSDYSRSYPDWKKEEELVLVNASKEIGLGNQEPGMRTIYRMDILDRGGNVVVDNVQTIYDVGPDRIALRRGFEVGLMDWEGNWIVKRSIFQDLRDD